MQLLLVIQELLNSLADIKTVTNKDKQEVVVSRNSQVTLTDEKGKLIEQHKVIYGSTLFVKNDTNVEPGIKSCWLGSIYKTYHH